MDSVHSGTGVFYQAIPAVGADGKNIMKLIPVQMVNGQFFHSQISKTGSTQQKAVDMNVASAPVQTVQKAAPSPPAAQQVVRKQVSIINVFPNQVGLDLGSSLNKHPLQQQSGKLIAVVPQMETPAANREKSGRLPGPVPVTVKAPAIPRGRYLQILPNAQVPTVPAVQAVPTVPASELPPRVKRPIFPSPADSPQSSGSAGVVYTSPPVTTASPQSVSALDTLKFLCNMSNATSCGSPKGQKPHLKLIPKVSHRPNSPIKWVVEDEDSFMAPVLDPANFSISSEILRVVAEREGATKHCDASTNPVSRADRKSPDGTTDADRRPPGRSISVNTVKDLPRAYGSAAMNMQNNEGPSLSSQQGNAGQPSESMEVHEGPANPNNSDSSKVAMDTPEMKSSVNPATSCTSSPAPESCRMADNLLRRIFGITADVRVCLQRIDGASVGSRPFLKDLKGPHESCSCATVQTEQELLEGTAPPSAHTHIEPLECSHFKLNARPPPDVKRHPGDASLKGSSRDVKTEPAFGYVEPIDEDFIGTDEKDSPNAQDSAGWPQTKTCAYLNANTRRMGRTRKRTMCPCCIPGGAQGPKWEEPGDWAWATEQTSKKGRRKKAVRKAVKASGRTSCLRVKNKRSGKTDEGPACDVGPADSNELKQRDEIRRLKELLKEQEAALEVVRH